MEGALSYAFGAHAPDEFHAPRELEHPLVPLAEARAGVLVWIQPHWMRPAYELWAGDRVVATLRFKGLTCSDALAASAEGLWSFRREKIDETVTIRQLGKEYAVLQERDAISSVLECANGSAYVWVREGLWSPRWRFVSILGKPILHFEPHASPLARLRVKLAAETAHTPRTTFLALLGNYLMLARTPPP
ncbi:MAG TPA: hypothetical protein VFG50_17830 [Rhodothermales bacterium]|nr:hypothetical protein [Rhodothermales bacterium]